MDSEIIWKRLVSAAAEPTAVGSDPARRELLSHAVTVGTTITDDSVGCSITETLDSGFRTPVASGPLALELDDAQYRDDDGPCVAACRDGQVHSITMMAAERAYPGFTRTALSRDVRSSLSLPLPGLSRASALNLYSRGVAAFEAPRSQAVASLLARCVAAVLATDPFAADRPSGSLVHAASGHPPTSGLPDGAQAQLIARAIDRLGERAGLDQSEAFAELTRRSRTEGRSIFAVCRDLAEADPDTAGWRP